MLTKINNMYQNRFISKASAKVLFFYDICKFFVILFLLVGRISLLRPFVAFVQIW